MVMTKPNLFLETSQKDQAWLDGFQVLPDDAMFPEAAADAVNGADKAPRLSMDPKDVPKGPEPFDYVQGDVISLSEELSDLVKTESPVLKMAATQLFSKRQQGKGFRPTLVTLLSLACSDATSEKHRASKTYNLQTRLAQITEMIHVASLIHDDVLDEAETRRGQLAVHQKIGNKVAVLAGDYLLATASQLLANLGDNRVVQIMASALKSLVQGEIMQLQAAPEEYLDMSLYLRKSYYKTGSLITLAANSAAVLGGHEADSDVARAAEMYGYHLGLAYQIVDDVLDFTATTDILGKPVGADMELGLATAPVLYALERDASLRPLIMRRFKNQGDVKKAFAAVHSDNGIALDKAMQLARWHAQAAVDAIYQLPPSDAREALVRMAHIVLTRKK
jgi:geranyl diphosphate synthase